jgi:hypothetical protein
MTTNLNVAFGPEIAAAATRHNLDPRLLAAVAAQETGGPGADSGRNVVGDGGHGRGLFQIDDRWHDFARTPSAMDPARNADYAAGLIESNLDRYGGDVRAALSAYNAGSPNATGTPTDWGDGKPVSYADSVLRHYTRLGGDSGGTSGFAGTTASGDPRDSAAEVDQLRSLFAALGGTGVGDPSAAGFCPAMSPLNLPAYRPMPQADARDRDLAPSMDIGGDPSAD